MKSFDFLQAMGQIDDKYIEEANGIDLEKKKLSKHRITKKQHWKSYYNVAALLIICVIAGTAVRQVGKSTKQYAETASLVENEMNAQKVMLEQVPEAEEFATEYSVIDYPALLQVDGVVFKDSGKISTEGRCGVMDGKIDSKCDDIPSENNQSNFGTGYSYQRISEDRIDVQIDGEWHIFVPYK